VQKPLSAALDAIQRVAGRPEGQLIREYLQKEYDNTMKSLIAANDPQVTRAAQGEARVLQVLLEAWKL